jgi:hypothetical protein
MVLAPCSWDCDDAIVHGEKLLIAMTAPKVPIAALRLNISEERSLNRAVVEFFMFVSIGHVSIAIDAAL